MVASRGEKAPVRGLEPRFSDLASVECSCRGAQSYYNCIDAKKCAVTAFIEAFIAALTALDSRMLR